MVLVDDLQRSAVSRQGTRERLLLGSQRREGVAQVGGILPVLVDDLVDDSARVFDAIMCDARTRDRIGGALAQLLPCSLQLSA